MTKEELMQIIKKLDKIDDRLGSIDKTLVKQEGNLELHMMRTTMSEKRLEVMEEALKPVTKHVTQLTGVLKFVGAISLCVGTIAGIMKILGLN